MIFGYLNPQGSMTVALTLGRCWDIEHTSFFLLRIFVVLSEAELI